MKLLLILIFILINIYFINCKNEKLAKEFEENRIDKDYERFIFKTGKAEMIFLIISNQNFNPNSEDVMKLTAFNNITKKSKIFYLKEISYLILEDVSNEKDNEYILKFVNYGGGNFIIFNSYTDFPFENFEKGFNFTFCLENSLQN